MKPHWDPVTFYAGLWLGERLPAAETVWTEVWAPRSCQESSKSSGVLKDVGQERKVDEQMRVWFLYDIELKQGKKRWLLSFFFKINVWFFCYFLVNVVYCITFSKIISNKFVYKCRIYHYCICKRLRWLDYFFNNKNIITIFVKIRFLLFLELMLCVMAC